MRTSSIHVVPSPRRWSADFPPFARSSAGLPGVAAAPCTARREFCRGGSSPASTGACSTARAAAPRRMSLPRDRARWPQRPFPRTRCDVAPRGRSSCTFTIVGHHVRHLIAYDSATARAARRRARVPVTEDEVGRVVWALPSPGSQPGVACWSGSPLMASSRRPAYGTSPSTWPRRAGVDRSSSPYAGAKSAAAVGASAGSAGQQCGRGTRAALLAGGRP
jgi:hypothetical protein